MLFNYFLLWFPLVILAIINGSIRQFVYLKHVGELRAHQLSTIFFIILLSTYLWLVEMKWSFESSQQAFIAGVMWLLMTLAFEFLAGHFIFGNSWGKLFHDYNLAEGRIWILVLVWTTIAPYLIYKLKS